MKRSRIEQTTASLAVTFLGLVTFGTILLVADTFFSWNIFPPSVEKILGFILISMFLIILSSVVVNIMINIGTIASTASYLKKLWRQQQK
jgi:drug/metabolite transporter (DMT)-like permease